MAGFTIGVDQKELDIALKTAKEIRKEWEQIVRLQRKSNFLTKKLATNSEVDEMIEGILARGPEITD